METLLVQSSKLVSSLYPFGLIEDRYKLIPEPVQRQIIYYSFPRDEKYILMYSNNSENFNFDNYTLSNVIQIGFHLTGKCTINSSTNEFDVSINFDRCKITSVTCTCSCNPPTETDSPEVSKKLIFWCDHVVALSIHRIRFAKEITLRVPISETLLQLNRGQLQKLIQYLLSQHNEVLSTAQNLADDLLQSNSKINSIHGAPDPTAGASKDEFNEEHSWALNENQILYHLNEFVNHNQNEQIVLELFKKTHLMLSNRDSNGPRIINLITTQFLSKQLPEKHRAHWDTLSNLWKIIAMTPLDPPTIRIQKYKNTLKTYIKNPNMPQLNEKETILTQCLELLKTDYNDLKAKKSKNYSIDLNTLRVQSLNAHGFKSESVCLSLKILKNLRRNSKIELENGLIIFKVFIQNDYKNEGLETALITLSQPRHIPNTLYLQEKYLKTEEHFIGQLIDLKNEKLIETYALKILNLNYTDQLPLFNFCKYLYKNVNNNFKLAIKFLKHTIPQTYITTNLEHQQVNLALIIINNNKLNKQNLDTILKTITINIKSISCCFKLAQESSRLEENNNNLLQFSFNLGLHVLKCTLRINHRRRWDIVRWIMNVSITCGFYQIIYLLNNWVEYFSPNEAVGTLANNFLSRGTSLRLGLNYIQQQSISEAARVLAVLAMRHDPGSCSLNSLTICESDQVSFETAYQIILEAAKKQFNEQLNCQQIFTIARYMEHRGYPLRAYKLAAIAIGHVNIPFNQETHSSISDIHWTCNLAQTLDSTENLQSLSNLLPVIISNIKCASVLSEILKRAALEPPPRKCPSSSRSINKIYTRLKLLVEATITSYISTIHNRLTHISPRHYADFIEYLSKAKEIFLYAPDGDLQFNNLINSIKTQYKGKKKLLLLLIERFG